MNMRYKWLFKASSGSPTAGAFILLFILAVIIIYTSGNSNSIFVKHCVSIGGTVLGRSGEHICIKDPIILDRQ